MTAHVEELVFGATRRLAVELVDLVSETLPLGQIRGGTAVSWICAVDEAKLYPILCKHLFTLIPRMNSQDILRIQYLQVTFFRLG